MTRPVPASATASAPPPLYDVNVESDFIIVLAALLCAFICVVGLIAVLRCTWLRQAPAGTGNIPPPCTSASNKGIKKKVLETLPKFTYAASSSPSTSTGTASKFSPECSICLSEFEEGDELRVLPNCGHGFHVVCIDTWLVSRSSCPSCRQVIVVGQCRKCGGLPMEHRDVRVELKERELAQSGNRNSIDVGFLP